MLKKSALTLLFFVPALAAAQTTNELGAAQALLNQLQAQLQTQLAASAAKNTAACPEVGVTLKPGARGQDVLRLQEFLALDPAIYPEAQITGYYGSLTTRAVQRLQVKYNIVSSGSPSTTGYGAYGPKTAAAVALQCSRTGAGAIGTTQEPIVGGFIKVTPLSGIAPLKVSIEANVNTVRSCAGATYTLSFGDDTRPETVVVPPNKCEVLGQTFTHVYADDGIYLVKLSSGQHETFSKVTVGAPGTYPAESSGLSQPMSESYNQSQSVQQVQPIVQPAQPASGTLTIEMNPDSYAPKNTTIKKGTKVTWVNNDSAAHTVSADNGSYNSGPIEPGRSYSLTFTLPGEYTYYCAFHGKAGGQGMAGRIVVQ